MNFSSPTYLLNVRKTARVPRCDYKLCRPPNFEFSNSNAISRHPAAPPVRRIFRKKQKIENGFRFFVANVVRVYERRVDGFGQPDFDDRPHVERDGKSDFVLVRESGESERDKYDFPLD